jgi:DNA-binding CsgD family transcriptional regulator
MDLLHVLLAGASVLTWDEFERLIKEVVEWLFIRGLIRSAEVHPACEVLEDLLNIHVAARGVGETRENIIWRARTSSNPNQASLKGLREAVYQGVNRGRFLDYRQRIYRQVKECARVLERTGVLQSQNRGKQLKRIGLRSWGSSWLNRCPQLDLKATIRHLPSIPCYHVQNDGAYKKRDKEPKIFDYAILEHFIPTLCEYYGAPLTMGEIASVIERKLSPPLYRFGKQELWPEDLEEDDFGRLPFRNTRDLLDCSEDSLEEALMCNDVVNRLKPDLTIEERQIFDGLAEGKSKRELAKLCKCAPGTVEKRRRELERKAARHDPSVRERMKYLSPEAQRESKSPSGKRN